MPILKITNSEKGSNKGSCGQLVRYLEKENENKPAQQKEFFFSHDRDLVAAYQVVEHIDRNKRNLGRNDAKFFMLNIAPSQKEQKHLLAQTGGDVEKAKEKLREFTRAVMEKYAENFGRNLKSEHLVWYAKIETQRKFKGRDREVQNGKIKRGEQKQGPQLHVHVVISRKDVQNKLKLSPLTSHRSAQEKGAVKTGFDRVKFMKTGEELFDKMFGYDRELKESFEYQHTMKHGTAKERQDMKEKAYQQEIQKDKQQEKTKQQGVGMNLKL